MSKVDDYLSLLSLSYSQLTAHCLKKYGAATQNYFDKQQYARFLAGQIPQIYKNSQNSRTSEGLYCHHIDEDKQILISTLKAILAFQIPYKYQTSNRLVYCNLIEHAILHIKIAIEQQDTSSEFQLGIGGYVNYLRPQLIHWLINREEPSTAWARTCYHVIADDLSIAEATKLISKMDQYLCEHYPIQQSYLNQVSIASYRK